MATNERTGLSKNTVGDVMVVDINTMGEKMTWIVNI